MSETDASVPRDGGLSADPSLRMPPDEMRRLGYRVVDALVKRATDLSDDPAWVGGRREEMEELFRAPAPELGRSADEVLDRALGEILPRAARIDHPRFFAFVPASPTWPSVLSEFLTAGFNIFQGTWLASAGPTQIELVVLDWFREWLGMPEGGGGLLTSGGSAANLGAVVAARERAGNPSQGVVYLGDQGHSSLERATRICGIPHVRKVPTGDDFAVEPAALERVIREDRERGLSPFMVCANAGATNTGAVDPLPELAGICRREALWFHVDGAYGGFSVLTARGKDALDGIGLADSVTLDPHKWLFQPFEVGCLLMKDPGALEAAFSVEADYLQDVDRGSELVNFADRGVQLTRRFRALKIWMSVETHGLAAFRAAIDEAFDLAVGAEHFISDSADLELLSPAAMGVVCYRFNPGTGTLGEDELESLNTAIQAAIVETGYAMISSTRLHGRYSLRLCIMNFTSTWADVQGTLQRVLDIGHELGLR
jgi:aromatic-L-amino-acid/L-tryptophan decarboxylase